MVRAQGHRRSLLDEMEHEEQSNRMYDDEEGGVPGSSLDDVFLGEDVDEDDDEQDEDDFSYSSQDRRLRRRSHLSNHSEGGGSSSNNQLDPLYEDSDEMVDGIPDMGYEDPDAGSSHNHGERGSRSRRSFNDFRSSGLSRTSSEQSGTSHDSRGARLLQASKTDSSRREIRQRNSKDSDPSAMEEAQSSAVGGLMKTIRKRTTFLHSRLSTQHTTASSSGGSGNITDAVNRLNIHQSSEFEHVAAAAAVVAASAQPKLGNQFGRGDYVLVMLTLLGMSDHDGEKDTYTIDPVNVHGYPQGKGKTEAQKQGPFLFVLCQVTQVHFDEDERYYTVRRCDTGREQRADLAYMEPIRDEGAIEVALRAAERNQREKKDGNMQDVDERKNVCQAVAEWYAEFVVERVVPFYSKSRNATKVVVKHLVHGDHGYAIRFRFSSVNLLVACSLIFLFLDVVTLTFLSAGWDKASGILGLVVWSILAIELIFEFLIRPRSYHQLMKSDKAFAPATARYINRYHLICELLALILYIPGAARTVAGSCGSTGCVRIQASLLAIISVNGWEAALGRFWLGLTFLRAFSLVRHWKQMWINHTYDKKDNEPSSVVRRLLLVEERKTILRRMMLRRRKKLDEDNESSNGEYEDSNRMVSQSSKVDTEEDKQLKSAATIGTALMLVNSHRALFLLLFMVSAVPTLFSVSTNPSSYNLALLLQANNLASNTTADCGYLENAVEAWFKSSNVARPKFRYVNDEGTYLQWVQMLPVRCDFQNSNGVITFCVDSMERSSLDCESSTLMEQPELPASATPEDIASKVNVRVGGLNEIIYNETAPADFGDGNDTADFSVRVIFNEAHAIAYTYFALFLLMAGMVVLGLIGLTVMRSDAERLVLFPLQRMLMIVVRYAENPLSTPTSKSQGGRGKGSMNQQRRNGGKGNGESEAEELGNYETEQLINAIAKIADLLRKCWGVAGAGIISSNLARTKDGKTVVFNPTIPGKQVYALFGFIGINDFSKQLRALEGDVMILINDVARVVHDEVYRWALGDSGQCNKNLGSAFLMVFRIGDFSEVHDKKKRATDVVFNSEMKNVKAKQRQASPMGQRRRKTGRHFEISGGGAQLQLSSLPGIQAFADRALLGCLKSFAGLHRDQNLQNWQKDFRLGAGVGNFTINAIYGFDAGWAVEGAVGSEYKIDATYLSPHVNMASRMMSACKQYGVKVLLSQAVEELLSKPARSKLRHLDTVYVKGSAVDQRIYTYDARHDGVDFFLFERSPDQADIEAESYTPSIWETDQDLKSMRQHVTEEFQEKYHEGLQEYLEGNWEEAIRLLEEADNMMFEEVLEQGFVDYMSEDLREFGRATTKTSKDELMRLKNDFGDGAAKCLVQYMKRRDEKPPSDWHGVRHLMSK